MGGVPFGEAEETLELDLKARCTVCEVDLVGVYYQVRGLCDTHAPKELKKPKANLLLLGRFSAELSTEGSDARPNLVRSFLYWLSAATVLISVGFYFLSGEEAPKETAKAQARPVTGSDGGRALSAAGPGANRPGAADVYSPGMGPGTGVVVEGVHVPAPKAGLTPQQAVAEVNRLLGSTAASSIVSQSRGPSALAGASAGLGGIGGSTGASGAPSREFAEVKRRAFEQVGRAEVASATRTLSAEASRDRGTALALLEVLTPQGRCREATETLSKLAADKGATSVSDHMRHLVSCEQDPAAAQKLGEAVLGLSGLSTEHAHEVRAALVEVLLSAGAVDLVQQHCAQLKAANPGASSALWRAQARCELSVGRFPQRPPPVDASDQDRTLWQLARMSRGEPLSDRQFATWSHDAALLDVLSTFMNGGSVLALMDRVAEPFFGPRFAAVTPLTIPWTPTEKQRLVLMVPARNRRLAQAYLDALGGQGGPVLDGLPLTSVEAVALAAAVEARDGNHGKARALLPRLDAYKQQAWVSLVRALSAEKPKESLFRPLLEVDVARPRVFRAMVETSLATQKDVDSMNEHSAHPDVLVALANWRR